MASKRRVAGAGKKNESAEKGHPKHVATNERRLREAAAARFEKRFHAEWQESWGRALRTLHRRRLENERLARDALKGFQRALAKVWEVRESLAVESLPHALRNPLIGANGRELVYMIDHCLLDTLSPVSTESEELVVNSFRAFLVATFCGMSAEEVPKQIRPLHRLLAPGGIERSDGILAASPTDGDLVAVSVPCGEKPGGKVLWEKDVTLSKMMDEERRAIHNARGSVLEICEQRMPDYELSEAGIVLPKRRR